MNTVETLKSARTRLAGEKSWIKWCPALDKDGQPCNANSRHAVGWCALGAVYATRPADHQEVIRVLSLLSESIHESFKKRDKSAKVIEACGNQVVEKTLSSLEITITMFNDYPRTTQEDVLEMYDRAIETAKENP